MSAAGWQVSDSPTPQNGGWTVSDAPKPKPEDNPPPPPARPIPPGLQGAPPQPTLIDKLMTPPNDAVTRMAHGQSRFTRTDTTTPNPILRAASNFGAGALQGAAAIPAAIEDVPGTILRTGKAAWRASIPGEIVDAVQGRPMVAQEQFQDAKDIAQHPADSLAKAGGMVVGGLATGEAGEAVGGKVPLPSKASLLDESAIAPTTDTTMGSAFKKAAQDRQDAATLKALNISPKNKLAQAHLDAAEGARPYLKGATNLEDLQAKVKAGKQEVWGPYQDAVDGMADKPVKGPDGPTTVGQLEKDRLELSAINRGLKKGDPATLQLAQQKGLSQADYLAKEKAVQNALDPELEAAGIKPKLIRQTFGQISKVGDKVAGRVTVAEPTSRFGLGRVANIDLRHPLAAPGELVEGAKDLAAGRPLIGGKGTDVAVQEAFRTGGAKPDLGSFKPPAPAPAPLQLPAPGIPDAEVTPGTMEGRPTAQPAATPPASPSVITPAPDAQPQLPAQAGPEGQGIPPVQPPTAPPLNTGTAATRTRPPLAPNPQPTPPGRTVVTPEGTAIPQRPQLAAPTPTPIKAPKSGVSLKIGDEITSGGKKGTVAGFNAKTGKVVVKWQ